MIKVDEMIMMVMIRGRCVCQWFVEANIDHSSFSSSSSSSYVAGANNIGSTHLESSGLQQSWEEQEDNDWTASERTLNSGLCIALHNHAIQFPIF